MLVYRLARKKYKIELSGKGAAVTGNRWNSKGVEMIYTASSRALAMAEVAVHLSLATLPNDYVMLEIEIPDNIPQDTVDLDLLPVSWNNFPHPRYTQILGDEFIHEAEFLILKVPSAVVKGDFNYLINPYHPQFSHVRIASYDDFPFDQRLFKS